MAIINLELTRGCYNWADKGTIKNSMSVIKKSHLENIYSICSLNVGDERPSPI